jgi:hypothetical protein
MVLITPSTSTNNNRRGYPTIQLQNTFKGAFKTHVILHMGLVRCELRKATGGEDDWFSFATFK